MRRLATLGVVLLLASLVGCKKSSVDREEERGSSDTGQVESALVEAQKTTTEKLDEIRGQIATLRNAAAAQRAEPDFLQDLAVATRLAGRLSSQAGKQQGPEVEASLQRLVRALAGLVASAPANRIQQHLERAEVRLTAGDMAGASEEVLAAAGEAYNPTAPALVPDVLSQLEEASVSLAEGDSTKAANLLAEVMTKTVADATAGDLASAHLTAIEGAQSLDRKAWAILMAQATQISNLLNTVEKRATPQPKPQPATDEPEASPPAQGAASPAGPTPGEEGGLEAAPEAPAEATPPRAAEPSEQAPPEPEEAEANTSP